MSVQLPPASLITGAIIAFVFAAATVLYDCHVSIQDRLKRVPVFIAKSREALLLACVCGVVAGVVFYFFTDGKGDTLTDSVLGLKQANPYLRGLLVGLTVLVLIRSKISSFKGAELGGEIVYNTGRTWVMKRVNSDWRTSKAEFNRRNLTAALNTQGFEGRLLEEVRLAILIQTEDFRGLVESQISNVQHSRPATAFAVNAPEWQTYYRTLTNLALDYAGPEVFSGWTDFH